MANHRIDKRPTPKPGTRNAERSRQSAESIREAQENRREAFETARQDAERRREVAEDARVLAEKARVAADVDRRDAMNSVHDTAAVLEVVLQHMQTVEELRRALRDGPDVHKLDSN
jgi:hypothetical protein